MRKVIQIAPVATKLGNLFLYLLCDDGKIYRRVVRNTFKGEVSEYQEIELSDLPQE